MKIPHYRFLVSGAMYECHEWCVLIINSHRFLPPNADQTAVPSSIRKLGPTAAKYAGFDVILTTYDAVKTKEVTISIDSFGHAILGANDQSNTNEGWLASRQSGAPAKCVQLSVLHRLYWRRIIFLDVIGRKGENLMCIGYEPSALRHFIH